MQGNWTVCVPLKYLILMPDIQEAKYIEFTVQIPPLHTIISVYALGLSPLIKLLDKWFSGGGGEWFSENLHK